MHDSMPFVWTKCFNNLDFAALQNLSEYKVGGYKCFPTGGGVL